MAQISPAHLADPFFIQRLQAVNNTNTSFYVRAEDELRLSAWTTTSSLTITLNGILVDLTGDAKPFNLILKPTSDGVRSDVRARLGPGFILYCYPTLSGGTPAVGNTTVAVEIIQSDQSTGPIVNQLLFGTLTAQGLQSFSYTASASVTLATASVTALVGTATGTAVSAPGAGNQWTATVPANQAWELRSIGAQLSTSASVANRTWGIDIQIGGVSVSSTRNSNNITASQIGLCAAAPGYTVASSAVSVVIYQTLPIPAVRLPAGSTINSTVANMQATDTWLNINIAYVLYNS